MSQTPLKILLIEDNPDDVALLRDNLAEVPACRFEMTHCTRLREALKLLKEEGLEADVILLDLGLPDSQGLETFLQVHQQAPGTPIVVLTGLDDKDLAIKAVRKGAQDYLIKGQVDIELLVRTIRYSIERMRIEEALRRARDELEFRVQERTAELAAANEALQLGITELVRAEEELRKALLGVIQAMAVTVEVRDPYTAGHQRRVADLALAIGQKLGLPEKQLEGVQWAAHVHDVGKINVPAEILAKPHRLSELEMGIVMTHSQVGYDILKQVEFPWPLAEIVLQHHERLDGSGYPQGLERQDILIEAKIIAAADVVEAMSSHRPYRPALGFEAALAEISQNKGILYDAQVAEACLHHLGSGWKERLDGEKTVSSPQSFPTRQGP